MSENNKKAISILGCGWLGLPLGKQLSENHDIKGSTTTREKVSLLKESGIRPFTINVQENMNINPEFLYSDILIISIPPQIRTKGAQHHINQIKTLIPYIENSSIKWVIYTSSTSVYPFTDDEIDESIKLTPENTGNQTLLTVENLLLNNKSFDTTILRLAGLFGPDRTLIKHFAGKKNLSTGQTQVNLVCQEDVIGCISEVIKQEKRNSILNICSDQHPVREEFYKSLAKRSNLEAPEYMDSKTPPFKIISNSKIKEELNYSFIHPDPMSFPVYL